IKWAQPGFGQGKKDYSSTIVAGNNLLVLAEDGILLLLKADPGRYSELGRAQVCGNTWSFPAYADGKLYVRDGRQLACYNLAGANCLLRGLRSRVAGTWGTFKNNFRFLFFKGNLSRLFAVQSRVLIMSASSIHGFVA